MLPMVASDASYASDAIDKSYARDTIDANWCKSYKCCQVMQCKLNNSLNKNS